MKIAVSTSSSIAAIRELQDYCSAPRAKADLLRYHADAAIEKLEWLEHNADLIKNLIKSETSLRHSGPKKQEELL